MSKHIPTASLKVLAAALGAAGLLSACGGGDDDDPVVAPPVAATSVPDSALASSSAYQQFVASLTVSSSETAEPLGAGNLNVPPSSETDEPAPVS